MVEQGRREGGPPSLLPARRKKGSSLGRESFQWNELRRWESAASERGPSFLARFAFFFFPEREGGAGDTSAMGDLRGLERRSSGP